jgi:hypothetical protein
VYLLERYRDEPRSVCVGAPGVVVLIGRPGRDCRVDFCEELDTISKIVGDGGLLKGAGVAFGECVTFVKSE